MLRCKILYELFELFFHSLANDKGWGGVLGDVVAVFFDSPQLF